MHKPYFKYFNLNLISSSSGVDGQKLYKVMNGTSRLTNEEKGKIGEVLKESTKEMMAFFGVKIDFPAK